MATPAFTNNPNPLAEQIYRQISQEGPMSFQDFMAMALYDTEHGYYARERQSVGKAGDFITSVSVGRCFGLILAHRLITYWKQAGMPGSFHILEPGAHDGALCRDILGEIKQRSPECYDATHYHLIEPSDSMQSAQTAMLSDDFESKFSTHHSLKDFRVDHGALISNELIDAFPVDLIEFSAGKWWQLYVDAPHRQLEFIKREPINPELARFCASLGDGFPEGYLTEFSPTVRDWARDAAGALGSGLMITIDYGHLAEDYYHPDRSSGTLQTYHRHQKSDNPLECPGEIDITCHVDFSRVMQEAQAAGFSNPVLCSQASYLTTHARDWLIDIEAQFDQMQDAPALLRQFQTLTHPAMIGGKFMVLEMTL
ncbi:MAG: class I SAM-dependent methyltransferase [Akkermansiaceae bacterium]